MIKATEELMQTEDREKQWLNPACQISLPSICLIHWRKREVLRLPVEAIPKIENINFICFALPDIETDAKFEAERSVTPRGLTRAWLGYFPNTTDLGKGYFGPSYLKNY